MPAQDRGNMSGVTLLDAFAPFIMSSNAIIGFRSPAPSELRNSKPSPFEPVSIDTSQDWQGEALKSMFSGRDSAATDVISRVPGLADCRCPSVRGSEPPPSSKKPFGDFGAVQ
jgi:hypothetical protein